MLAGAEVSRKDVSLDKYTVLMVGAESSSGFTATLLTTDTLEGGFNTIDGIETVEFDGDILDRSS